MRKLQDAMLACRIIKLGGLATRHQQVPCSDLRNHPKIYLSREAVLKLLEELKAEMKEKLGDKLAGLLLFGSHSTGDYTRPQMWTI